MAKKRKIKLEVIPSSGKSKGQNYTRIKAGNGEVLFTGESYKQKAKARHALTTLVREIEAGNYEFVGFGEE